MNEQNIVQDDISQLIERLKPVYNYLTQNAYVKDTTRKLKRIVEDAQANETILFLGKERVGKTSVINSLLGRDILSSSIKSPTRVNAFIKYAEYEIVKAVFLDGMEVTFDISKIPLLTTSDSNSAQIIREHIDYIEIYLKNELLRNVTLVDTTALESDQGGSAYFSQLVVERIDEIFWVLRAGSPATDAELSLIEKYAQRGIKPKVIVNAIDSYEGNILQFIESEQARYGHVVDSFVAVSSKLAMESSKTNNAQLLIDSNFVQFVQMVEKMNVNTADKLDKTVERFADWLQLFKLELKFIPTKEPYLSALQTIEKFNEEHHIGSTRDERDREIVNAYRDEYKEVSEVFHSVQTLYQLLQKLASTFYLRDVEAEQFEELAFSYQQNVRDYRKLHTEYSQSYSRVEGQYKKAFGKYLQQWSQHESNEQITSQVENIKKQYRELKDLMQMIKNKEKLIVQNFYKTQNHLTDLAKQRLRTISQQVSELNKQRKIQVIHLKSYNEKLQEYSCVDEAQRFLLEAVRPFILSDSFEIDASLKEKFKTLFDEIEHQTLNIARIQNEQILLQEAPATIEANFETQYQLKPLSLTEADIVSDIPELPASM